MIEATTSKDIGRDEVINALAKYVDEEFKTRQEAATSFGITPQYLWAVLNHHKRPNEEMLKAIGYAKRRNITTEYYKEDNNASD